jgi:hypothetical protein
VGVSWLLRRLDEAGASEAVRALAARAAARVGLDTPVDVAALRKALQGAAASDAIRAALDRDPADAIRVRRDRDRDPATRFLDDLVDIPQLMQNTLRAIGGNDAVATLAAQVSLRDPAAVAALLGALHEAGASAAVRTLLARDPAARVSLDDPVGAAWLLRALDEAGASEAAATLADRAADAGMFDIFLKVHPDEASSYLLGREPDGAPS